MRDFRCLAVAVLIPALTVAACANKNEKPMLTREAFAAAVQKCQPIDAGLTMSSEDGVPPIVEITIPDAPSTVPDCMAKAIDGFRIKELRITYARPSSGS